MGRMGMLILCIFGRPLSKDGLGFIFTYFHFWFSATICLHWFKFFLISAWYFLVGSVGSIVKLLLSMKSRTFVS